MGAGGRPVSSAVPASLQQILNEGKCWRVLLLARDRDLFDASLRRKQIAIILETNYGLIPQYHLVNTLREFSLLPTMSESNPELETGSFESADFESA